MLMLIVTGRRAAAIVLDDILEFVQQQDDTTMCFVGLLVQKSVTPQQTGWTLRCACFATISWKVCSYGSASDSFEHSIIVKQSSSSAKLLL